LIDYGLQVSTFALIPGAGGMASYWHRCVPLLEARGHVAIAIDLPADDERAGFSDYADVVVRALGTRDDIVVVAQSLGGFTAPLVCARVLVRALVLVNAMIPLPGETAGAWWENTGATEARKDAAERAGYSTSFDMTTYFFHDVPPDIVAQSESHAREQSEAIFAAACTFEAWPEVAIHVIAGRDDRFFPIAFQRRVARERLHVDVEELPGGHLVALSNPRGLVELLLAAAS
jgi:pimeloyl-ACP methyl ester carboxylesterase